MSKLKQIISGFFTMYTDGFRNLSAGGKKLWIIILIKLFIMFAILRLFFFPDILKERYDNDRQRSEHVLDQMINATDSND